MRSAFRQLLPLTAAVLQNALANGQEPASLDGLLRDSDAVLHVRVESVRDVPGGLVHILRVIETLRGDAPGALAQVFTLRAELPDAPGLSVGEECILGVRWADLSNPVWQSRLATRAQGGGKKDREDPSGQTSPRMGILAADGKLPVQGNEAVSAALADWIAGTRDRMDATAFQSAVLRHIDDPSPLIRHSVIDAVAERAEPLDRDVEEKLRLCLKREVSERRDPACLRSLINLSSRRNLPVRDESLPDRNDKVPAPPSGKAAIEPKLESDRPAQANLARLFLESVKNARTPSAPGKEPR